MVTIENKVWYLKRSRLFERATDDAIAGYEHLFMQITYPKRTIIFEQGDVGRLVYMVKIGRVRIARATEDGKEITVAILGPVICSAKRSSSPTTSSVQRLRLAWTTRCCAPRARTIYLAC